MESLDTDCLSPSPLKRQQLKSLLVNSFLSSASLDLLPRRSLRRLKNLIGNGELVEEDWRTGLTTECAGEVHTLGVIHLNSSGYCKVSPGDLGNRLWGYGHKRVYRYRLGLEHKLVVMAMALGKTFLIKK